MSTKSKIALSLALVLGAASAAIAAPKHPIHDRQTAVKRQVPAAAYESFGSVRGTGPVREPTYMYIQDQGLKESDGG